MKDAHRFRRLLVTLVSEVEGMLFRKALCMKGIVRREIVMKKTTRMENVIGKIVIKKIVQKRTGWIAGVLLLALTGCGEPAVLTEDAENAMKNFVTEGTAPLSDSTQSTDASDSGEQKIEIEQAEKSGNSELQNCATESKKETDSTEDLPASKNADTLTAPPSLEVSTLYDVDQVTASPGNYQWSAVLPDGTAGTVVACGLHPLDQQEHPLLYTAFPAGSLPPLEEGVFPGSMIPTYTLNFGDIPPETVTAVRWPASLIGTSEGSMSKAENVSVETEADTITLMPFGDGDFVYEICAEWGETGSAYYTFRTLAQVRED